MTALIQDNEPRYIVTMYSPKLGRYNDERIYDFSTLIQYIVEWQFDDLARVYYFDADTAVSLDVSEAVARSVMEHHRLKYDEPCNAAQNWMARYDIYWD